MSLKYLTVVCACSSSMWFPGWKNYVLTHTTPDNCIIYLSLGIKEEKQKTRQCPPSEMLHVKYMNITQTTAMSGNVF